jgi:hypothetical protein
MPSRLTDHQIQERATRGDGSTVGERYYLSLHLNTIRNRRINELLRFARYAARMAQQHETDGHGWYGQHVVWAIGRLCELGYSFPETEPVRVRLPRLAAAA